MHGKVQPLGRRETIGDIQRYRTKGKGTGTAHPMSYYNIKDEGS